MIGASRQCLLSGITTYYDAAEMTSGRQGGPRAITGANAQGAGNRGVTSGVSRRRPKAPYAKVLEGMYV